MTLASTWLCMAPPSHLGWWPAVRRKPANIYTDSILSRRTANRILASIWIMFKQHHFDTNGESETQG